MTFPRAFSDPAPMSVRLVDRAERRLRISEEEVLQGGTQLLCPHCRTVVTVETPDPRTLLASAVVTDLPPGVAELTPRERDIFGALLSQPGKLIPGRALVALAFGALYDTRNLNVHLVRLRRKLIGSGYRIETVLGVGYRLHVPAPEPAEAVA